MLSKAAGLSSVLLLCSCASVHPNEMTLARSTSQPKLFVGHSTHGDLVVAASHYDAMNGLAVAAVDLGLEGERNLLCSREVPTGTHVQHWICRYQDDAAANREATRNDLSQARLMFSQQQSTFLMMVGAGGAPGGGMRVAAPVPR